MSLRPGAVKSEEVPMTELTVIISLLCYTGQFFFLFVIRCFFFKKNGSYSATRLQVKSIFIQLAQLCLHNC